MAFDLLKNRDENVPLGPFDSKVGAVVTFEGESYYITSNTDYIPSPPLHSVRKLFRRRDFRLGDDDPAQWPQRYVAQYCHLAAIPRPKSKYLPMSIMWWTPSPDDFYSADDAAFRVLCKLQPSRFAKLQKVVDDFWAEIKRYETSIAPETMNPYFSPLMVAVNAALERLSTIPSPHQEPPVLPTTILKVQQINISHHRLQLQGRGLPPFWCHTCHGGAATAVSWGAFGSHTCHI
ncbi:hypothetical protein R3P38DRAFT_3235272 [Favolaschia claudopus]|uniref:Uncharacterized protein n=1 Tax=Favolaschia claudopus TaxID=2862362 RepID=A0AAV9ZEG8_9AGAR